MRVLIVSAAILACASCAPSGLFVEPLAPLAAVAPVAPVLTVNGGDIAAAAIDGQVAAQDHARAAIDAHNELTINAVNSHNDAARELADQAREINEERFWNAEDQKWQTYDAIKTAESKLDGASAEASPVLAKSLVAAPAVAVAAPVYAAGAVAHPIAQTYAAGAVAYPVAQTYAAGGAIAYDTVVKPETKTVVTQSLSQTHPAPLARYAAPVAANAVVAAENVAAAPLVQAYQVAQPVAAPVVQAAIVDAAPIAKTALIGADTIVSPAKQTVATQSLSQTHPAPLAGYAAPVAADAAVAAGNFLATPFVSAYNVAQPVAAGIVYPGSQSVAASSLSQSHGYSAGYAQPTAQFSSAPVLSGSIFGSW